jgi:hypothetical protein
MKNKVIRFGGLVPSYYQQIIGKHHNFTCHISEATGMTEKRAEKVAAHLQQFYSCGVRAVDRELAK